MFPAPLEVDRYLYHLESCLALGGLAFPAPREVDRFLYKYAPWSDEIVFLFPAPLEVARCLYKMYYFHRMMWVSFRPLSR